MSLTLEEKLLLKTSKHQDDKNTILLLQTKQYSLDIIEKVLIYSTLNDNSFVISKLLKWNELPIDMVISAFWLSINETKKDAFSNLEHYLEHIIPDKEKVKILLSEFEANSDNVQHVINIIKEFQE